MRKIDPKDKVAVRLAGGKIVHYGPSNKVTVKLLQVAPQRGKRKIVVR